MASFREGVRRISAATGWLVLLALVAVGSAYLLSPALDSQQIPDLTADDVGKPLKTVGGAGVRAWKDHIIPDEFHTERRRAEVVSAVRPVFDFDTAVQPALHRTLRDAFSTMQELVEKFSSEHQLKNRIGERSEDASEPRRWPAPLEDALLERLRNSRAQFEAMVGAVDDGTFDGLARGHFSREAERIAVALVDMAYQSKLVASRDELSRFDRRGIVVRLVRGTSEFESETTSPAVRDIREAQAELDRLMAGAGEIIAGESAAAKRAAIRLVKRLLQANLSVNIAETEDRRRRARESVAPIVLSIHRGQLVAADGELVTETHLAVFEAMRRQTTEFDLVLVRVGLAGLVALFVAVVWMAGGALLSGFRPSRRDALFTAVMLLIALAGVRGWSTLAASIREWRLAREWLSGMELSALSYAFPVSGVVLATGLASGNARLAAILGVMLAPLCGIGMGGSLEFAVWAGTTGLVAAALLRSVDTRGGVVRASFGIASLGVLSVVLAGIANRAGVSAELAWTGASALVGGLVLTPLLVFIAVPVVEAAFGYASVFTLRRLSSLNHPALKELIVQAPGTYHHSIIVGSLVEAAAPHVGAQPLLARACALYHDIGKVKAPQYFGENRRAENPHDLMNPQDSADHIRQHVSSGVEVAKAHHLPRLIVDCIEQHHGTRCVEHFFHRALKEQRAAEEGRAPVDETRFRYRGPRPTTKEIALVMLADVVEAASRGLSEASSEFIESLVSRLVRAVYLEGQLDACNLTSRDIEVVIRVYSRVLERLYHTKQPPALPGGAAEVLPLFAHSS